MRELTRRFQIHSGGAILCRALMNLVAFDDQEVDGGKPDTYDNRGRGRELRNRHADDDSRALQSIAPPSKRKNVPVGCEAPTHPTMRRGFARFLDHR